MTVLVRRGALGDVVLLGAVTAALEGPVTVVTDERYLGVARRLRGVDRAVAWPELPAGDVVDLHGSLRSWRLTWRRRPRRVHKHSLRRRLRLWTHAVAPRPTVPELYAAACGVRAATPPWIDLPRQPEALLLAPGAAWQTKRWGARGFVEVGRGWDGPVAVLGGPGEADLVSEVARAIPGAHALAETGFEQTFEWMGRGAVLVSGDTGLMHLAGACGVPVVSVFGPTHPSDGFFVYDGVVVQRELACRPCTLHRQPTCPRGHHGCMDLPASRVTTAVRQLWPG